MLERCLKYPLKKLVQRNSYIYFSYSKCACDQIISTQPFALRAKKAKSSRKSSVFFLDSKKVCVIGGKGGDGCTSFLQLWCNENAGPDGGDGGNGGHVVFQVSSHVRNFNHVSSTIRGFDGESGKNKNCLGRNAQHKFVKVPVGTVIRNDRGHVVGDLNESELMFVAARGGVGGKGNRFFVTSTDNSPKVCEFGPVGEEITYMLELKGIADIGFIGYPNAGKSTLLSALTRANPNVAPYPFTTVRPYIGIVQYDDLSTIALADLPGLIPGSHRNKGLGIQFLKYVERCKVLLFVLDASSDNPWKHYEQLLYEIQQFNGDLALRPQIVVANKIDKPKAQKNMPGLLAKKNIQILPISAKMGYNLSQLTLIMRTYVQRFM